MRLDRRVPEPELMEDPGQAAAYSDADFAVAHDAVIDHLLARWPAAPVEAGQVIDLGCGPADVTARLAQALPRARVVGVDAGARMLALGRERVEHLRLSARVELRELHLPAAPEDLATLGRFDLVASNSLLHHLQEPAALWATVTAVGAVEARVHVVDLLRPEDDEEVDRLVRTHAPGEPEVLVEDFRRSLRAAYRPEEVAAQLRAAGLDTQLAVEVLSDRHLLVHGQLRPSR